jgi:PIN domain nuclease of toxin-antitoxin system
MMRFLIDTRILLWSQLSPRKLSSAARDLMPDPKNEILFSAASIWEIAIKAQLGRMDFRVRPEQVAAAARADDFTELPVYSAAAASVSRLPPYHGDPFDRLFVAQALSEPARFLTSDARLAQYSDLVTII